MVVVVYSDKYLLHDNKNHPENAQRLVSTIDFLKKMPFYGKIEFVEPSKVSEEEICKVHTIQMVERAKEIGWLDKDTYTNEYSYEVAKLSAGGAIKAMEESIKRNDATFALIRPPGHHATSKKSMGFCLFNNVAISAELFSEKNKKVLIFDHDVHHGNGTQEIFYERDDVLYQSFHLYPHYPGTGRINEVGKGRGEGYTINAPLPYKCGERCIEKIMEEIFIPVAEQFSPDIILISAGFDSHHADYLGGLNLTVNFYGKIISAFRKIQKRIVCCLEGGYNLNYLPKGIAVEISQMCDMPVEFDDYVDGRECNEIINEIKEVQREYWRI